VLDEIDYGLILVAPEGQLQHANHLARYELARSRTLCTRGGYVVGQTPALTSALQHGIQSATKGKRQMLTLRHAAYSLPVACVPLFSPFEGMVSSVLLMLGRQVGTQNLAVTFFSQANKLTPAEEKILRGLCDGQDVLDIASANGVAESTVRTQIRSLREKTGNPSIRQLVQNVAALPPVVPALRPSF
jgi:DNA-binding NarL/FixJ family response regulator